MVSWIDKRTDQIAVFRGIFALPFAEKGRKRLQLPYMTMHS